jgi:hypothetical protein
MMSFLPAECPLLGLSLARSVEGTIYSRCIVRNGAIAMRKESRSCTAPKLPLIMEGGLLSENFVRKKSVGNCSNDRDLGRAITND